MVPRLVDNPYHGHVTSHVPVARPKCPSLRRPLARMNIILFPTHANTPKVHALRIRRGPHVKHHTGVGPTNFFYDCPRLIDQLQFLNKLFDLDNTRP